MQRSPMIFLLFVFIIGCAGGKSYQPFNPVDYVDPFIGATNPGATTPWGMMTITPVTQNPGAQPTGRLAPLYQHGGEYIYGFSHTTISDGRSASAGLVLMPVFGDVRRQVEQRRQPYSLASAAPGFYKVKLDDDHIFAEMTATPRTAFSRYYFQSGWAHVVVDPCFGATDSDAQLRFTAPNELEGYRYESADEGATSRRKVFFVVRFERLPLQFVLFNGETQLPPTATEAAGDHIGAVLTFRTLDGSAIQVQVGLSFVSTENARLNLNTEQRGWTFEMARLHAQELWQKELAKIMVYGGAEEHKKIFYSALYRALLSPNIFQDVNGQYALTNGAGMVGAVTGSDRYTNFSLSNDYGARHPLFAAFYPARQLDMLHSLVGFYLENGTLPQDFKNNDGQIAGAGNPAALVFADTFQKGLTDFDVEKAYEAALKNARPRQVGKDSPAVLTAYNELGYVPLESEGAGAVGSSVAATLELALADYAIAQLAQALGKTADAGFFRTRSANYKNLFDAETGFFRPRRQNGDWLAPFSPTAGLSFPGQPPTEGVGYGAGSAWNYAFFAPHDAQGLVELFGRDQFVSRLQTFFTNNFFDIGNRANLAFPFLFNDVSGEEWRAQQTVRDLVAAHFSAMPNSLPGSADAGVNSAWLVWAMLGLYPACPANPAYQLTTPFFERIEISLDKEKYPGEKFVIDTENLSEENIYIRAKSLNGKKMPGFSLRHENLVKGGRLELRVSNKK